MAETLGTFEQAALLAVLRLGDEAYGRSILQDLERRLGRPIAAGAAYATLNRLEARGLVSSRLGSGTPERGGRARRFYRVEAEGLEALNDARLVMKSIWRGVIWPAGRRA